ncbi:MAG TPA: hypothetical protein VFB81_08385, partial [Myxococcales bacterium]|nr:hypothetical protein [Myxococcales bacterium]
MFLCFCCVTPSSYVGVGRFAKMGVVLKTGSTSGFGESCALGNGWCEYASDVGGFPAADWVARNKRALMLNSWASCSPSAWTGRSDGSLPWDAQGSEYATGTGMTPAPGQTWRPSHGVKYGSFCHSAIVDPGISG